MMKYLEMLMAKQQITGLSGKSKERVTKHHEPEIKQRSIRKKIEEENKILKDRNTRTTLSQIFMCFA